MKKNVFPSLSLAVAFLAAGGLAANAATSTWSGATDSFWTTALNWDTAPTGGEDIVFPSVANQTVDLAAGTYTIGALTFNSPNPYSLANGGVTLGGTVSQNGAGTVTLNADIDLGGADRVFGGAGAGVVTFNNPINGNANNAIFGPGSFVIANAANTVNQIVGTNGGKVVFQGTTGMAAYPNASYFGGNGASGGGYVRADGGTIDYQQYYTDSVGTNSANFIGDWNGHGIDFGPNGGTLLLNKSNPVDQGPTFYRSSATNGTPGTVVIGRPLPFTGDGRGTTNYVGPWDIPANGLLLGPAGNAGYGADYARRQGAGDLAVIITNGATAYLEWSIMTNGNLIIKGQPGGNSAAVEVDANGTTTNVGRLGIRGPHRGTQQPGYQRAFYVNQPYAMKFNDAVQVWERDGMEHLACDMSFEAGSSVDFCGGKLTRVLDLGWAANDVTAGETNTLTIKSGGKCNLNLQLRTQQWEGNGPVNGESAGLRVFAKTVIQDNGQLRIYRSQTNAPNGTSVKCIEIFRPITGQGTSANDAKVLVELPYSDPALGLSLSGGASFGTGGVNFNGTSGSLPGSFPGADLIVNGAGDYGLRLVGFSGYVSNLLANGRASRVTGTGGTLTVAATSNDSMWIAGAPTNSAVSLGLDSEAGSTPTYVLRPSVGLDGFAGLILKGGTAMVEDSSSVTMKTLRLAGSATIQLGTGAGGSILTFSNSSAVAWNAGTLTITSWNGSAAGGGSDRIKFGTDATGLTAGQLAQIKWINPYGGGDVTKTLILSTGEIVPAAPPTVGSPGPSLIGGNLVFGVAPGNPGASTIVQCATNLTPPVVWQNIVTNTGTFSFTNSTALPAAFYRLLVQ